MKSNGKAGWAAMASRIFKKEYLLPATLAIWILFIFVRSLQPAEQSNTESQRVLEWLQRLLPFPLSMGVVRKLAHFTEFAFLGLLAAALFGRRKRGWSAGLLPAFTAGLFTALCDETIQLFVPGRAGQVQDVWIDAAGACFGILAATAARALWKRKTVLHFFGKG